MGNMKLTLNIIGLNEMNSVFREELEVITLKP